MTGLVLLFQGFPRGDVDIVSVRTDREKVQGIFIHIVGKLRDFVLLNKKFILFKMIQLA